MIKPIRRLNAWTAVSVVIGCVIGSGVFVKPGRVLAASGDSNGALLAWFLGGMISLTGGLTIAEVASRIPKTGGIYVYVEELFGKTWGFICGWVQALVYGPALMSALSLYFATLAIQFFGLDMAHEKSIAFLALFTLSTVSALSTGYAGFVQNLTTVVKLIPIACIGIFGLFNGDQAIFGQAVTSGAAPAAGMGVAILATLWAYDGWMQVSNLAGEIENPAKNLPKAIVIGLTTVIVAYMLVNLGLFHTLPKDQIAELNAKATSVAATILFGSLGGKLLSLGVLVSILGCLNGNILSMTRIPFAMATRGAFPYRETFSRLHPTFQTPVNSILFKVVCASIMIALLDPERITDLAIFSMYLFYAAVFLAIFKVRKIYGKPPAGQYRIPLYPVVPLVAVGGCTFICVSMAMHAPKDAMISIVIAAIGYPVSKAIGRSPESAAK